jgi:hypothetical protein
MEGITFSIWFRELNGRLEDELPATIFVGGEVLLLTSLFLNLKAEH